MKPVEIEFLMRDKLSDGLNKAGQAATSLGDKVTQSADQVKAKITEQKAVVKQVENDLKDLEKQYGKLAPGAAQAEMKAEIIACKKVLEEEKAALMGVEKEYEQTRSTGKRLSMQLREMQDAMAKMRLEGKATSPEYQKLAADAANLADTIGDLRTQTNILANDDAGLQGVMSGVNGLAGGFTVATGIMGVFASENEDLIKIQTKVQSVMAITMGLQQVMNALNKDSAFRLVTVARAKDMLTGANVRLATALGISNAAATALMATLTLGLSLVVTGLVIAWNKYSDAQAKAAAKAAEMVDIEKNGRAEMIKARVEIDNTKKSLKDFTGTKEQEKSKVEELNRKYGETFGYYKTIAEWYDVLQEKGEDYIQMLFLQAKAQSLVNKAVEADEKVAQVKATPEDDVDGSMGWFKKMLLYSAQGESNGQIDARKLIDQHNKEAKEAAIKSAEEEKQAYLDEAAKLQDDLMALKKKTKLGDFVPDPKDPKEKPTNNLAELEAKARLKIEEQNLALRQEGYDKQRAQAKLEFEKEKARIEKEEKDRLALYEKLKKAGVKVTPEQKQEIGFQAGVQKVKAAQLYDKQLEDLDKKELKERQENLNKLLEPYRNFAQQRLDIEKKFQDDIDKLQAQTSAGRLKKIGDEMTAAFGNGNVDLLARPQIDAAKLVAAGWKDAGEGIATVFSSQFGIQDASGKETEILVTPILPDGTVLSETELQDYVDNVLNGADDLLAADTKGIVISVGVDADGSAGELLHEFQEKYYDLKNNTADNADIDGQIQEAIIQAEQVQNDNLAELDRVYAEKDVYFQALMSQLSSMTLTELEKTLDQAEKALAESEKTNGKDSKDTAVARAKVAALKDEIKYVKAENETKAPDDAKKWKKNSTAIKRCKAEIDGMIGSMDGLDEGTKAALQAASNVAGGAIAMIDGIKTLSVSAGESISAVEKASVILAIVGAAIQIMTAIFSMGAQAEKRHQEALAEVAANKLAMQREYNLLLLQQNLLMKEAENIFGEQSIAKAARAVEVYRDAIQAYKDELKGEAPTLKLNPFNMKGSLDEFNRQKAAYEQGIRGLYNVTVKTGHKKTGLFGWGKGKDIYTGVLQVYPDLIDGENRLNMERAKSIISTQTMSDENKNLLQSLIDLQEQADEAQQALRDYLTDTFGSLGDGMMDSIVDAIKTGNDAWQSFGDKGAEVLENLGRQIAYSLFFAGKFDKLQKQLEEAYGSGKSEEQIAKDAMNIMGNFYAGIGKDMDQAQQFMENWQSEAAKRGFNLWKNEDGEQQSGKSGAFQTMDQETGTELKGLFTSVQGHVSSLDENVQYVSDELHQSTDYLREIAENTSGCNDKLKAIAQDIETIRRDGLKTQ